MKAETDIHEIETKEIAIQITAAHKVNLALQQNSVPVLRDIVLNNPTDVSYQDLELTVTTTPKFANSKVWHITRLAPQAEISLRDCMIELNPGFLEEVNEAVRGTYDFSLKSGGEVLATASLDVQVLSRNEWGGIQELPEILAAYVQPNSPFTQEILRTATKILEANGRNPMLDGYQSRSRKRSGEMVNAIWSAVVRQDLAYAEPPASFEDAGQKIRLPEEVKRHRLVTCMDSTLLFAGALEQAGFNSLVIFTKGHAFVGVWLEDLEFSTSVVEDLQALRKRVDLKEILVFETTFVAHRPAVSFKQARQEANSKLFDEDRFLLLVDIKQSRLARIRPLYEQITQAGQDDAAVDEVIDAGLDDLSDLPEYVEYPDAPTPDDVVDADHRVENWKRKLLDLSLRNRLLNFKRSKRAVPLICTNPGELEDMLAENRVLTFSPLEKVISPDDPRSGEEHRRRYSEDLHSEQVLQAMQRGKITTALDQRQLSASLITLYRASKAAIEEGGTNILYLALGFLNWTQKGNRSRTYQAPLILIPVSLSRRSVNAAFKLRIHDDEPQFNPTLLQMLRQDFGLEIPELSEELPKDDSGLDVNHIWNIVRRQVRDLEGWEVSQDLVLSTFSFAKYLMWADLDARTKHLKSSPLVKHLIDTPRDTYMGNDSFDFPRPQEMDFKCHPKDTYLPMSCDSTQMAAVIAASEGMDFVIEGPPGTGKSQTIANMITHLLGIGKRVLFVSEKTAALDVVYRRLRDVELGKFCLELHSSKARKTDVIQQLDQAWKSRYPSISNWEREAEHLVNLREDLNAYVRQLHKSYANDLSIFQAIGVVINNLAAVALEFNWPDYRAHTKDDLEEFSSIAARIDANVEQIGDINKSCFYRVEADDWSPSWQRDAIDQSKELHRAAVNLQAALQSWIKLLGLPIEVMSRADLQQVCVLERVLPQAYNQSYASLLGPEGRELIADLEQGAELIQNFRQQFESTAVTYKESVLDLEIDGLLAQLSDAEEKWFLAKWLDVRAVKAKLKPFSGGSKITDEVADLALLSKAKKTKAEFGMLKGLDSVIGRKFDGIHTNPVLFTQAAGFGHQIRGVMGGLFTTPEAYREAISTMISLLQSADLLGPGGQIQASASTFKQAVETFEAAQQALGATIAASGDLHVGPEGTSFLQTTIDTCIQWVEQAPRLKAWTAWRRVRNDALAKGMRSLVDAVEQGMLAGSTAEEAFRVNYHRWWLNCAVDNDEVIRKFVPAEHARKIEDFVKLDRDFMQLTRYYVYAKLSQAIPSRTHIPQGSTWHVLSREIQKKRRHMPVRRLVEQLGSNLFKLTPCVMMSPMSVAQYLPPEGTSFDVVIFDEASQITPWDAIGAIARASQAIVVGDPKQLPPTSFFSRQEDEYSDSDIDIGDLESILDECMGANLPTYRLKWHYRSRQESLITFSNHNYYRGGLITFPSPATADTAVSFHYVKDGLYEKGGNRINLPEARVVVGSIVARLRDPEFKKTGMTIGVVTFNQEQQVLIEDLLEKARQDYPEVEPFFAEDNIEAIFVKNIESVQGDERSIIYFSMTYGKDYSGRLSMNFGPMNQEGGPRRLNVVITRARNEMHVYSSMQPEDIDLSRTAAAGVKDMKHFMDFAKRGTKAIGESIERPLETFDSPFEKQVAVRLEERGWTVHSQIGVSGFRIDLGVVHPDHAGRYIAGIECDGATYHRSATARDRDFLRQQVLEGLGWKILRVWSTDWWITPEDCTEQVDQQLRALLESSKVDSEAPPEEANNKTAVSEEVAEEGTKPNSVDLLDDYVPSLEADSQEIAWQKVAGAVVNDAPDIPGKCEYIPWSAASHGLHLNQDSFYEFHYRATHASLMEKIVQHEQPIRVEVLFKLITRAHGFKSVGSRINRLLSEILKRNDRLQITTESSLRFVWLVNADASNWNSFRVIDGFSHQRAAEDVAMPELIAMSRYFIDCGCDQENAVVEMRKWLGMRRIGEKGKKRLEAAYQTGLSEFPAIAG